MSQIRELEGNPDTMRPDLSLYAGEKAKAWKTEVTLQGATTATAKLTREAGSSEVESFVLFTLAHSLSFRRECCSVF